MSGVMYDGVNPDTVPPGAQAYAGYVNGYWPSYNALVAKYPNAQHVPITVNTSGTAQVLDVEQGDAAAVDVPNWLNRMRAAGVQRPTIYCSRVGAPGYGWQNVIDACRSAGVALPDFWIADYTSSPHPLTLNGVTAVAVQWTDHGGYDESQIYDATWPATKPTQKWSGPQTLVTGQTMNEGNNLASPSGRYGAVLQFDGNFVVYDGSRALWANGLNNTFGPNHIVLQSDGNLVAYLWNNHALWATWTVGKGGKTLTMQDDGNLVLYADNNKAVWATYTQNK